MAFFHAKSCKNPDFLVTLCLSNEQEHLQPSTLEQHWCLKSYENRIPCYPKDWIAVLFIIYEPCNAGAELPLPVTVAKRLKALLFLKEKVVKGKNTGGSWLDESNLCSSHSQWKP